MLTEDQIVSKQQALLARRAQLEIEQEAIDAAIEAHGYDGAALMYRAYYEAPEA